MFGSGVKLNSMRSAVNNPFTPGSDTIPQIWVGRREQIKDWETVVRPRLLAGLYERGRTILGEAGLGKSSLVRRIADSAVRQGDWVTPQLRIPVGTDPLKAVSIAVLALADMAGLASAREQRIQELLNRVRAIAASGVSLTIDASTGPEPYMALTDLLAEVGTAAIKQNNVVLIHIDEVQNIDSKTLSQLLIGLGDAMTNEQTVTAPGGVTFRRTLPIAVYLTGLPDFADITGERKGATFARRFAMTILTPLSKDDLDLALRPFITKGWEVPDDQGGMVHIRMTEDAAEKITELCCGEPFLFQLAGARAWYAGTDDVITVNDVLNGWASAVEEATAHVERILARLPEQERKFIEAMASLPPDRRTLSEIAKEMGFDNATQAGTSAQRLDTIRGIIDRGKPYQFRHRAVEAYLTSSWPRV